MFAELVSEIFAPSINNFPKAIEPVNFSDKTNTWVVKKPKPTPKKKKSPYIYQFNTANLVPFIPNLHLQVPGVLTDLLGFQGIPEVKKFKNFDEWNNFKTNLIDIGSWTGFFLGAPLGNMPGSVAASLVPASMFGGSFMPVVSSIQLLPALSLLSPLMVPLYLGELVGLTGSLVVSSLLSMVAGLAASLVTAPSLFVSSFGLLPGIFTAVTAWVSSMAIPNLVVLAPTNLVSLLVNMLIAFGVNAIFYDFLLAALVSGGVSFQSYQLQPKYIPGNK